jgi:hypothetical protein
MAPGFETDWFAFAQICYSSHYIGGDGGWAAKATSNECCALFPGKNATPFLINVLFDAMIC